MARQNATPFVPTVDGRQKLVKQRDIRETSSYDGGSTSALMKFLPALVGEQWSRIGGLAVKRGSLTRSRSPSISERSIGREERIERNLNNGVVG